MRAYAWDLRTRIVAAVEAGETQVAVAQRFGVAVATIRNYVRLQRTTGSLTPRSRPGGQPEIGPERYPQLQAQVQAAPDATLAQHCTRWAEREGQVVSVATMWRTTQRLGWTYKKNGGCRRARRGSPAGVAGGGRAVGPGRCGGGGRGGDQCGADTAVCTGSAQRAGA